MHFVVFLLDGQRYALPLSTVERIVGAVAVAGLPGAPAPVLGAIDVEGAVVPVLCMRRRFGLPEREIAPHDQFLIARASARLVALVIDEADSVMEFAPSQLDSLDKAVPGLERFQGLARLEDGMVLIHDLDRFLSVDESRRLDVALEQAG